MLINSINLNSLNFTSNLKAKRLTPKPCQDTFKRKLNFQSFQFSPELSIQTKKELISQISNLVSKDNTIPPLGHGATGMVYRLNNIEGLNPYGAVAKISFLEDKNQETGERQKVGIDYNNEIVMLKKVKSLGDKTQQYLGKIRLNDGRNILLTTYVLGKNPDLAKNPMTKEALGTLVATLGDLDTMGILHRDLKKENIIIDNNSNTRLIDFGEAIEFDFLNEKKCDGEMNFPSFMIPSNIQNFEDTFLSQYIADMQKIDKDGAKDLYQTYLSQKAELVHKRTAKNLLNYLENNGENLTANERQRVKELYDYQVTMAHVLSKKSDDDTITNIEMMKNQITYMSELAYKNEVLLANPLANVTMKTNAVICAKKLEAMVLNALNRPNSIEMNKYLQYQYKIAKYRQNKISGWLTGFVGWLCTCVNSNMTTMNEGEKKFVDDCLKENLENFEIPNIATKQFGCKNEDK